ncbi:hypothetical protein K439DRAFT_1646012 [Ramaria rubella]|nr:hypothetical protein K439DRAFT_1646012 [Ramaria rubella]
MYYDMGMNDKEILTQLHDRHLDLSEYGLACSRICTLRKMCHQLGLQSIRKQAHTIEMQAQYPKAGMHDMRLHTFCEEGLKISRRVMEEYFRTYEPNGIKERRAWRLKCVEPYSGMILWLRVWWTNKNPRLILHYYLNAVQEYGGMPLVTQSDPGTENYGVANGHTTGRHMVDPSLEGTQQHRWMRDHNNVKPEITWSQLHHHFTPGVEDLLDNGLNKGWYDPSDPLDIYTSSLLFCWLFIPWLQGELEAWKDSHNMTPKCADKNKILPHSHPQLIFEALTMFDSLDFKVFLLSQLMA